MPLKKPADISLLGLSASQVVRRIRRRELTAEAYAQALLAQADQWQALNAFITLRPEQLLADARAVDKRIAAGELVGPLAGLPILVKDCIDTADYPTTSGTPSLQNYQPKHNAVVVQRLLDAGAIIAGKTNMHEIAYGITSNNQWTGPVHNPYNLELIPGGSSGGTAAALAARIGVVGLGTDTGGSVRIPASLCGLVGLRTTLNRWPIRGIMPASHSRDVIGPFGHSVTDVALMDSVITSEPLAKPLPLKGVRLGVPRSTGWIDLDPETKRLSEQALAKLQKAGVELVDVDMQAIVELDQQFGFPIALFETPLDIPPYLIAGETGVTYNDMVAHIQSPAVKQVVEQAPSVPYDAYIAALAGRARIQALYAELWEKYRIQGIIFPTTPLPARPIGQEDTVELNGQQVPTFPTYIRNTGPASVAEIPGLSLPIGLTKDGLPVGLEIDGPTWHDRDLIGLGLSMEKVFRRIPAPKLPS